VSVELPSICLHCLPRCRQHGIISISAVSSIGSLSLRSGDSERTTSIARVEQRSRSIRGRDIWTGHLHAARQKPLLITRRPAARHNSLIANNKAEAPREERSDRRALARLNDTRSILCQVYSMGQPTSETIVDERPFALFAPARISGWTLTAVDVRPK